MQKKERGIGVFRRIYCVYISIAGNLERASRISEKKNNTYDMILIVIVIFKNLPPQMVKILHF